MKYIKLESGQQSKWKSVYVFFFLKPAALACEWWKSSVNKSIACHVNEFLMFNLIYFSLDIIKIHMIYVSANL